MNTVRLRYPFDVAEGRLCTVIAEPVAVRGLLAMVRDLAPGDFPSMPQLYNPCDLMDLNHQEDLLPELQRCLRTFFNNLLPGVGIETSATPDGDLMGYVTFERAGAWRFRVPIHEEGHRLILDLDAHEEV